MRALPFLVSLAMVLMWAPQAHATSGNASAWDALYGGSASHSNAGCQLCHGGSTQDLNPYGSAIAHALQGGGCSAAGANITARIQAVEGDNSDGDSGGYTNIEEINASTQPGWTTGLNATVSRTACNTSTGSETAPSNVGTLDPVSAGCTTDGECDDGVACNGAETCDVGTGICLPGTTTCGPGEECNTGTDTCDPVVTGTPPKNEFNIVMNYELGMHCTGFEFAYCCVLPPYNSILAQVIKTEKGAAKPELLQADPNVGVDGLGRPTVVRDKALDGNNDFKKYQLRYWHDAQPRNDGRGAPQTSTLISIVEGNSLLMWNTVAQAAYKDANGALVYGADDGSTNTLLGDGTGNSNDNYWNAIWNHLYFYSDLEGTNDTADVSAEADKVRLGIDVVYPENTGAALHSMGPGVVGAGFDNVLTFSGDTGTVVYTQMKVLENLPVMLTSPRIWEALGLPLTPFEDTINFFSDPGAVDEDSIRPYVRMRAQLEEYPSGNPVLDNGQPVIGTGTAPIDIPNCERCHSLGDGTSINSAQNGKPVIAQQVQDEIDFWNAYYGINTGAGDSDWYSRLKGAAISILGIHDAQHGTSFMANWPVSNATCTAGDPSKIGQSCNTPSDCDSPPVRECTSPGNRVGDPCTVDADCNFKKKSGTCGSIPAGDGVCESAGEPHATRLGHGSVMCQRCHADNVIAVVKSADCGPSQNCDSNDPRNELWSNITGTTLIKPLTEALHNNHAIPVTQFSDSLGRDGSCQGCHPAHRSDGDMSNYPITELGLNAYAGGDNRDAAGGCFVGRDVHSNPDKDTDGVETPSHLNAVGQWLLANVANDTNQWKGIWCTNCHSQLGQELWKRDQIGASGGTPFAPDPADTLRDNSLQEIADAVAGGDLNTVLSWMDPKESSVCDGGKDAGKPCATDADCKGHATCVSLAPDGINQTFAVWNEDPGMCNHAASLLGLATANPYQDGNVATIEINLNDANSCSAGYVGVPGPDCGTNPGNPSFWICIQQDVDGDVNVHLMDFCTTDDCVAAAQATLTGAGQAAVPVPFSAATDGRDHWLSAGEPHCADCHAAPYVENTGDYDRNFYPPFNYPGKYALNRYSRGHQDITCQGCHESIHGLYPTTQIDTTSYAQAASMNTDGSHGPLKCGACHVTNADGVIAWADQVQYNGQPIANDFDAAVSWAHTYTDEASPLDTMCLNCHEDRRSLISSTNFEWVQHAYQHRTSRDAMDKAEIEVLGHVSGATNPQNSVCTGCHNFNDNNHNITNVQNCSSEWKNHLIQGRVAESVWEAVSTTYSGGTCGW